MVLETIILPLNYGPMVGRYARLPGLSGQDARRERPSRGSWTRTSGLSVPNAARYHLRYAPEPSVGAEPTASSLPRTRSTAELTRRVSGQPGRRPPA